MDKGGERAFLLPRLLLALFSLFLHCAGCLYPLPKYNVTGRREILHFFSVTARLQREKPNFSFYRGREQARTRFSIFF